MRKKPKEVLKLLQNTPLSRCTGIMARDISDGGTILPTTCGPAHLLPVSKGHLNLKTGSL
jgi:hypothetical protein